MASKAFALMAMALCGLCVAGCANLYQAPLKPPSGALVTSVTIPLTTNFSSTPVSSMQCVESTSYYLFWPYPIIDLAWQDGRSAHAKLARQQVSRPLYAEVDILTVFGLFGRYTVNVYAP